MRNIVIFAIIGLMLFGCINPPPANNTTGNGTGTLPIISSPNATNSSAPQQNASSGPEPLPPGYTVGLGDKVSVIYALYVDSQLYDTNNATLANESGMFSPLRKYQPFNYTVEFNKGVIDGFIINTIGMRVNETISFSVQPDRGYGPYDPKKAITVARYYNKSLFETVPLSYFTERGINVTNGTGFDSPFGTVFAQNVTEDNVTIFYMSLAQSGTEFRYLNMPQQVVEVSNFSATIELLLKVNESYTLADPNTGAPTRYLVLEKGEENITLDSNHPLANKTLYFSVTLLDVVPARSN